MQNEIRADSCPISGVNTGNMEAGVNDDVIVAIPSRQGMSTLPENENILPNQNTWAVTTEKMGIQHAYAQKQAPHVESIKEHEITEHCIGSVNGRKHTLYTDPYSGGEQGSKCAKSECSSLWQMTVPVPPKLEQLLASCSCFPSHKSCPCTHLCLWQPSQCLNSINSMWHSTHFYICLHLCSLFYNSPIVHFSVT
jgi:hypothetical protein